jgi:hypothetical protein
MDDQFLKNARREPRPEFARSLRERLRRQETVATGRAKSARRFSPFVTAFAALLVIAGLFSIPAVRASAQAFLDLFRVRNFAAVTVDAARLEQLRNQQFDVEAILGQPQVVRDPGPLQMFLSAREAASAAGYTLREAVDAPRGLHADTTYVRGESMARLRIDANRLRSLLSSLAIDDVQVPSSIDGAEVNVHILPVARTVYRREGGQAMLIQAPSPELSLPPGIDIAQLGEIGLRIAGLSSSDARRFAQSVDWHSTLLVPVPSNASSFREVDVRGHKGLLVSLGWSGARQDHARWQRTGSQLMWSDGDRVFAVVSQNLSEVELVQMANAVQ